MESIRSRLRGRLLSRREAGKDLHQHSNEQQNPPAPDNTDIKRRAKDEVRQLEKPDRTLQSTPSPVPSEGGAAQPPPITDQSIIPSLPTLNKSPTSTATTSAFLDLPSDLICILTQHLNWNSLLALRSTCSSLYALLNDDYLSLLRHNLILASLTTESLALSNYRLTHPRTPQGHLWDLFYAAFEWQLLERPAKALTCYGCLEVKPLHAFVERMSTRGTGLGGRKASQRRCKDCMRRGLSIAGVWWRDHWVRKAEIKRRRGRGERAWAWLLQHRGREELEEEVKPGDEVGVCTVCGTAQFELFWGCAGCFEKEEERRRRQEWGLLGLERADGAEMEGWVRWVLERADNYRGRKEKRRRRRYTRRAEGGGRWYSVRRLMGWMAGNETWTGSWGERVEALVEYLHGPEYQLRRGGGGGAGGGLRRPEEENEQEEENREIFEGVDVQDNRRRKARRAAAAAAEDEDEEADGRRSRRGRGRRGADEDGGERREWKAADQVPVRKDRRETRCCMCWVPTSKPLYTLGLAYESRLRLHRCCGECQEEEAQKRARRGRKKGGGGGNGGGGGGGGGGFAREAEGLEDVRNLFGT